ETDRLFEAILIEEALRTLRRGRISWWIPLVGAVVTYAVVYICIAVPLLGDPAFMQYVTSR
ncbi:MAG: hypothetical protein J0J11_04055, partial [Microbacterium sp.]|nr:hypothetical protein [Microbacterium sp.]